VAIDPRSSPSIDRALSEEEWNVRRFLTVLLVLVATTAIAGCQCCKWNWSKRRCSTPGCSTCTPAPSLYDPGLAPSVEYSTPAEPQATYSIPQ
jgi:hypothetical protein